MNVFDGVTKEMFIKIYNKRNNTKLLEISEELKFDLVVIKRISVMNFKDKKIISDILNYESEIEVFNSFDVMREYNGEEIIICDNLNKYFKHRKIKKEVTIYDYYYNLNSKY